MTDENEKMIVEEEKYRKELEDFRNKMHGLMDGVKEKELYEKVTNPKKNDPTMGVRLTPQRNGDKLSIRIDIPIDVLQKWMGEKKEKTE